MSNRFVSLSIVSSFLLILLILPACSDTPTAPIMESDDISEVTPTLGKLQENVVIPWSVAYFVPCANGGAGEVVQTDGNVHFLRTVAVDAQGGHHGTIQTQAMDITGVGLSTGDVYQANGLFREQANFGGPGAEFEDTYVNSFTLIGPGKDNNLQVQVVLHITVDANGEITAYVEDISMECR